MDSSSANILILLLALSIFFVRVQAVDFKDDQNSDTASRNLANSVDFIRLPQPPIRLHQNLPLHVEYFCKHRSVIYVDVRVWTESQHGQVAFSGRLNCTVEPVREIQHQIVRLKLPRYLAYQPSRQNKFSVFIERRATIEVWMTRSLGFRPHKKQGSMIGTVTMAEIEVMVELPFERPARQLDVCLTWWSTIEQLLPWTPKCPYENEIFHLVHFPLVLNGGMTGLHVAIPPFKSRILEWQRSLPKKRLQFTYVFWVYVTDYCKSGELCSLLHHLTWDDRLATPTFFLNSNGRIQLEFVLEPSLTVAFLTPSEFFIPKFEWVRLMISANPDQPWILYLNYGPRFELKATTQIIFEKDQPSYDDSFAVFTVGGSEIFPSFTGYIGEATLYRRRSLRPEQIALPSLSHPMFRLQLVAQRKECLRYFRELDSLAAHSKLILERIFKRKTCPNPSAVLFSIPSSMKSSCQLYNAQSTQLDTVTMRMVRRLVFNGLEVKLEDIGEEIYRNATQFLEEENDRAHFSEMETLQGLLQEASCLGSNKASFLLSIIRNYGLAVSVNETQAQFYLMSSALNNDRLSLLSLGNKHVLGIDGFPKNLEQAYVYYKAVADVTRNDLDLPDSTDSMTEIVRLTSETDIISQTEETGDLFMWLKHQAAQGVLNAQQNMARMLYWGVQGIKKNVAAAAEYYKLSASSGDPVALYNYGIIQLKGHGTQRNVTAAVESLKAAARLHNPEALNTLGWHALEIEKNHTKAADYFLQAHNNGNRDATFNLAHMYLVGTYPGSDVNRDIAYDLIVAAATRGQLDAGIIFAMYITRGHPKIGRHTHLAMEWARYIAEQNPSVGRVLSRGVRAFRKGLWKSSLIYYLMAASTGVEVANFNLAYLCDENYGNVASFLEKECKWRHFNLSMQRPDKDVNPYAWIKMAEYYYYGASDRSPDIQMAAEMYIQAAKVGDPQGIFSLASMVQEGTKLSPYIWEKLGIQEKTYTDHLKLLVNLYSRCRESSKGEAYLPCTMALYRTQFLHVYLQHEMWIVTVLVISLMTIVVVLGFRLYHSFPATAAATGGAV